MMSHRPGARLAALWRPIRSCKREEKYHRVVEEVDDLGEPQYVTSPARGNGGEQQQRTPCWKAKVAEDRQTREAADRQDGDLAASIRRRFAGGDSKDECSGHDQESHQGPPRAVGGLSFQGQPVRFPLAHNKGAYI